MVELNTFADFESYITDVVRCQKLTAINPRQLIDDLKLNWDGSAFGLQKYVNFACSYISSKIYEDTDYDTLAAHIYVTYLHKITAESILGAIAMITGEDGRSILCDENVETCRQWHEVLDKVIDYSLDYKYNYFAIKTLEKMYLLKRVDTLGNTIICERPQQLLMRVAITIAISRGVDEVIQLYRDLANHYFTMATPVNFNSGTNNKSLASCFLLDLHEDSIKGMYKTVSDCAAISKMAGGIGINLQKIRSRGSHIRGTNCKSDGILPYLKVLNTTARHVSQGGRRAGSIAVYLELHHPDILEFLDAKKPHGNFDDRAMDLFYGLWVSDLFMKRVEEKGKWSLFDPNECPSLLDLWGDEFEQEYIRLENEPNSKARKILDAGELFVRIIEAQIETGTPYLLAKDTINRCSNQKNVGVVKSSNLCAEIVEVTDPNTISVCNLGSLAIPAFVVHPADGGPSYIDHKLLWEKTRILVRALNGVIAHSEYPCPEANYANKSMRPMGCGLQGLAKALCMMKVAYASEEGVVISAEISETVYHAAITESHEMAVKCGRWDGDSWPTKSPMSLGIFQFDNHENVHFSGRYDWASLKKAVVVDGVYNSLFVAIVPTATTAQLLNNTEACEQLTSNLYVRKVMSGEHIVLNANMVADLKKIGKWNGDSAKSIKSRNGSIQHLDVPESIKRIYLTAWESPQSWVVKHAVARAPFVDQSQSMNLFFSTPSVQKISSAIFYGWRNGLKTLCYYVRTQAVQGMQMYDVSAKPVAGAEQASSVATKTPSGISKTPSEATLKPIVSATLDAIAVCRRDNPEGCLMCSG